MPTGAVLHYPHPWSLFANLLSFTKIDALENHSEKQSRELTEDEPHWSDEPGEESRETAALIHFAPWFSGT